MLCISVRTMSNVSHTVIDVQGWHDLRNSIYNSFLFAVGTTDCSDEQKRFHWWQYVQDVEKSIGVCVPLPVVHGYDRDAGKLHHFSVEPCSIRDVKVGERLSLLQQKLT